MLGVKEAAGIARGSLEELYGKERAPRLEVTELSQDGKHCYITLSYVVPVEPPDSPLDLFPAKQFMREYKSFKIEADSGRVVSMKIRKP